MGDSLQQKTYTVDFLTKKRVKNNGIVSQYYVNDNHEAIIPKELFRMVQEEKSKRANLNKSAVTRKENASKIGDKRKSKQGYSKYLLANIMICSDCGQPYRRLTWSREGVKRIVWRCKERVENGTKRCHKSPTLDETELQRTIMRGINRLGSEPAEFADLLNRNMKIILNKYSDGLESTGDKLDKELSDLENKMLALYPRKCRYR